MRIASLTTAAFLALTCASQAQSVAEDDFGYVGALTDNGWVPHSGGGSRQILSDGSFATLSQAGGSGEDISRVFAEFGATAKIYGSFDFRIPSGMPVNPDGDGLYFAHFKDGGTAFRARAGVLSPVGGGDFGFAINADAASLGAGATWPTDLSFDTWYKVVMSWDAATGASQLWIDPQNESSASISHTGTFTGTLISAISLRQSNDYTGLIHVDRIRAGRSFCDVIPIDFDTNLGTALGVVGDDSMTNVTLAFAFPFPDGVSHSSIDIDSNGRIVPAGADTSDLSESVAELLAQATSICPYWDDLNPVGLGSGDIFLRADADVAVITWNNIVRFSGTIEFSFQCQLYPDGRIVFAYDTRVDPANDALVGLSEGNAAANPGASLLRQLTSTGGTTTVYQLFGANTFNLIGGNISFTPVMGGGWCIYDTLPPPPIPGVATKVEKPCDVSLDFQPDGMGGYNVSKIAAFWVDDSMMSPVDIGTGLGDDALTAIQTLGHAFPGPGGGTWTSIKVDNNGVIHNGGGTETTGDFNPSVLDLTNADSKIAVFWLDLSSQLGALRFATNASMSVVTWDGVPQFAETNDLTFQAVLNADGSFQLNYRDISQWRTGTGATSDDVIIGCSQGALAADPGESDYTNYPVMTAGNATVYEFWDASLNPAADVPDIQTRLYSTSIPQLGGTVNLAIDGISSSAAAPTLLLGFFNPNVPLDLIGVPGGFLLSSAEIPVSLTPAMGSATFSLALPNNPGFVGLLNLYFQVAYFAPENTFGLALSDGVRVSF